MQQRRRAISGVAGLLAVSLAIAACGGGSGSSSSGSSSKTLTVGSTTAVQSWDPAFVGDANYVPYAQAAYDSLIRRTAEDKYVPMLATKWTVSNGNKAITLELRTDVTFSDGTKFDATAVKANVEHFAKSAGPLGNQLAGLADATVVNDHEITLNFKAGNPDIVYNLSDAAGRMASPKAIGTDALKTVPVGTGPYVMDTAKTVQGSTYVLKARQGYWDKSLQKFGSVVFRIYPQETALLNAIKSGQVDAGNLSAQDNVQSAKAGGISVLNPKYHISWAGLAIYDRGGKTVPALAKKEVRQAIAHAIDADGILKAAFAGSGKPNTQLFNESSPGYDPSLNNSYAYDPAQARQLMQQGGYANGFTLPLPAVSGFLLPAIQTALQKQLGEIGIKVQWINETVGQLYPDMAAGKFAAAYVFFGSVPTDWSVVQSYLTPTASWNPFKTTDPALQAIIDRIPGEAADAQNADFAAINKWAVENVWFDPWFWVEENFAVNKTVKVELQPKNNVPFIYNYSPAS
jgi:peptide/nickel transport system substrate-binding protein